MSNPDEQSKAIGSAWPTLLPLVVVEATLVARRTRRLTLSGEHLGVIEDPKPGQWVKLFIRLEDDSRHGRAYTIRKYDRSAKAIDIDVTLHGKGNFACWAARAELGDKVECSLPCGSCKIPSGGRRCIFAGDETAAPAILTILQSLHSNVAAEAYIEVDVATDIPSDAACLSDKIRWLSRDAGKHRLGALLKKELLEIPDLEANDIWLAGEQEVVATLRQHCLLSCGVEGRCLQSAGYWKRGTQEHRDDEGEY